MSRIKHSLTIEEHQSLGLQLQQISVQLTSIAVIIGNAYGAAEMDKILTKQRRINQLRFEMENREFNEHPKEASIRHYWPLPVCPFK